MIGIAIDGPSGAGKSTIAKALAKDLGYIYVDTGAIYRTVGLYMQRKGVSTEDKEGIENNLPDVKVELKYEDGEQKMYLCDEEVSGLIRTPLIAKYASVVSAVPKVREFLFDMQRSLARENNVIMDGRDIGTVILPDADVKIFLTASAEARAQRRVDQLVEKGETVSYDDILASIKERDARDSGRDVAPLKAADDAVTLDTSALNLEESIAAAKKIVVDTLSKKKSESKVKTKDKNKSGFYMWARKYLAPIIKFCMRVKTYGSENEQESGALIVCANHTAMLDVLSLAVSFKRQLRYLAKKELFKIPLLSQLITALGAYAVDRGTGDVAAIKKTLSILEDEEIVAMFPQGTRHKGVDPALTEVKHGVGMMVYRSKADVQPVFVRVKNYKYRFLRKKEVIIGKPIRYEEFGFTNGGKEEYERAAKLVFDRILALRYEGLDK
ncbi:MAG: (d)CMP kinase [Clostridia bacterium]|nr:(d)CMP kinase [Clostridia bacterium]